MYCSFKPRGGTAGYQDGEQRTEVFLRHPVYCPGHDTSYKWCITYMQGRNELCGGGVWWGGPHSESGQAVAWEWGGGTTHQGMAAATGHILNVSPGQKNKETLAFVVWSIKTEMYSAAKDQAIPDVFEARVKSAIYNKEFIYFIILSVIRFATPE